MTKYACLTCCKTFSSRRWHPASGTCPDCGDEMVDAGKAFKAPRRRDKKAWAVVAELLRAGFQFHAHGIPRPTEARDVAAWIKRVRRKPYFGRSKKQRLVDRLEDGELQL